MSLTNSLGLGGVFGGQSNQASQPTTLGQGMWVTTTSNTSGQTLGAQQAYNNANGMNFADVLQENQDLLKEVRDELLDMKKWLIATYPDIYKQYVCVKQLEEASK